MRVAKHTLIVSFLIVLLTIGVLAAANDIALIEFPGAFVTEAHAINKAGSIVGQYGKDDGLGFRGFAFMNGGYTSFNYPGSSFTALWGIDDNNQMVGQFMVGNRLTNTQSFSYYNGAYRKLNFPLDRYQGIAPADTVFSTAAQGVSTYGVVGNFFKTLSPDLREYQDGPNHGWIYRRGSWLQLDYPGATSTFVTGISNAGVLVGSWYDSQNTLHGFIYTPGSTSFLVGGSWQTLDRYNGANTWIAGINAAGTTILGSTVANLCGFAPFIYKDGQFRDLGLEMFWINGISDTSAVGQFGFTPRGFVAKIAVLYDE